MSFERAAGSATRAVWQAKDGVGTIEFAAIAGVLAVLMLGIVDFGIGFWEQMRVANSARAGAEFALRSGYDSTNIQTAERNATNLAGLQTGTPAEFCGCPDASSGITAATCASSCPNGDTAGTYVSVSSSLSYTTIFAWPGVSRPMTLASSAIVRLN